MLMNNKIKVDFFCDSKKWPRRFPKIKQITSRTIKNMKIYFNKSYLFNLNLILSDKIQLTKLNKKYKKKHNDTDVLTFVTNVSNKKLGKILYCDIFFSIDTIEKYITRNNIKLYDHFNHLLIHSLLHVNGYDHKSIKEYNIMKKEEIGILKSLGIKNPYL